MASVEVGPPIYLQIARAIQSRVFHRIYSPGDAVPSESQLAAEFGVSRLTVRQAVQELRREGTLVSRRGSGTYVAADAKLVQPVSFIGYLDDLLLQALTMHTEVAFSGLDPDPPAAAREALAIRRAQMWRIERTRFRDREVMNHSVAYLAAAHARKLDLAGLGSRSLTELVCGPGAMATHAFQAIRSLAAPADVAARLELMPSAPVLMLETAIWNERRPVIYSLVYYRSDRHSLTATLVASRADGRFTRSPDAPTRKELLFR